MGFDLRQPMQVERALDRKTPASGRAIALWIARAERSRRLGGEA